MLCRYAAGNIPYPRACGGDPTVSGAVKAVEDLSPRMRG